jgi:dolichol-phosphate mannosyltransferase
MKLRNTASPILFVIGLLLAERLVLSAFIPLIPQEAYYWMYSRHPEMSYFDHPPMVAWMIGLGTAIFGTNEFGVRIVGELLMLASIALLYRISRMLYGRRTALFAAAGFPLIPLYFHVGWLATMDAALVFFFLAAMLGFLLAVDRNDARGWWIAGLGAGAAMLSKYTGIFSLAGMFLAMLIYQPWRDRLRRPGFYFAGLGALAMFTPVVRWNHAHHWASFRFQTVERLAHPIEPLVGIGTAIGGQTAVVLPLSILIAASLICWGRRDFRRLTHHLWSKRLAFAIAFSLPLLGILVLESLRINVHINWAAAHRLRAICRLAPSLPAARMARRSIVGTAIACAVVATAVLPYVAFVRPKGGFLANEFGPWPALANEIHKVEEQLERQTGREPLVVADGPFELASEIGFYRAKMEDDLDGDDEDADHRDPSTGKFIHVTGEDAPSRTTTSQWLFQKGPGNGFPFWLNQDKWIGCDVLYVSAYADIPSEISSQTDSATLVTLPYLGGKRQYHVVIGRNLHLVTLASADH